MFFPIQKNLFLGLLWSLFRALYRLCGGLTGLLISSLIVLNVFNIFCCWFLLCRNNCGFVQCFWDNVFGFVGCEILRLLELLGMLSYLALSVYSSSAGPVWLPVLASNICPILQTRLWIVSLSLDYLFFFGIAFFLNSHKKYRAKSSTKSDSEPGLKLMVFCDSSCSISLFMLGLRWPTIADTSKCSKSYEHRCYKIRYLLWSKLRGCCFFIFGDCEGGK